jgi:tripartite-type tricarboxylate transporter receptor subunit TctC
LVCLCAAGTAAAQTPVTDASRFPAKPIRLIVPFPPGGSNDILARFLARKMGERLPHQTIVDNRPGADGIIGTEVAARAPPDGHTLLIVSTSYTINPAVHKVPYDGSIWWGMLTPAGVPPAIVVKLNSEINAILGEPEMAKRLSAEAADPVIASPEAFAKLIANDLEKWNRIAKLSGIRAE